MFIYRKTRHSFRIISFFTFLAFVSTVVAPPNLQAQNVLNLPAPGTMVAISPSYTPILLKGLKLDPGNPFQFDFIVDRGNSGLQGDAFKKESAKIIRYFMASLTTPEQNLWVNLSPYEEGRILSSDLDQTELGRDLLTQDYLLKQLTASLIYPEDEVGKKFWERIKKLAYEKYGTKEIPVETFNKVWIVPQKAVVYENGGVAFVAEARLRVMMEEDYLAASEQRKVDRKDPLTAKRSTLSAEIIRELILPEIEKEVNEGKNFAALRQIYHAVILSGWFKVRLKESLLGQVYVDQNKTVGIDVEDRAIKEKVYQQYLEAYKKGVYNYVKEDWDAQSKQAVPRKYFSGGAQVSVINPIPGISAHPVLEIGGDKALLTGDFDSSDAVALRVRLAEPGEDAALSDAAMSGDPAASQRVYLRKEDAVKYLELLRKHPEEREGVIFIVGAGPAGVVAGLELLRLGYKKLVYFEAASIGAGLATWGIPDSSGQQTALKENIYRWFRQVLAGQPLKLKEEPTQEMFDASEVKIFYETEIDVDIPLRDLESLDIPIFLAVGAPIAERKDVPGSHLKQIIAATNPTTKTFFRSINIPWAHARPDLLEVQKKNYPEEWRYFRRHFILGGGNASFDAAFKIHENTQVESGRRIMVAYHGPRWAMVSLKPGYFKALDAANQEEQAGIEILDMRDVVEYLDEDNDGTVDHVRLEKLKITGLKLDADGNPQILRSKNAGNLPMISLDGRTMRQLLAEWGITPPAKMVFKTDQRGNPYIYQVVIGRTGEYEILPVDFVLESLGNKVKPLGDLEIDPKTGAFKVDAVTGRVAGRKIWPIGQAVTRRGEFGPTKKSAEKAVRDFFESQRANPRNSSTDKKAESADPNLVTGLRLLSNDKEGFYRLSWQKAGSGEKDLYYDLILGSSDQSVRLVFDLNGQDIKVTGQYDYPIYEKVILTEMEASFLYPKGNYQAVFEIYVTPEVMSDLEEKGVDRIEIATKEGGKGLLAFYVASQKAVADLQAAIEQIRMSPHDPVLIERAISILKKLSVYMGIKEKDLEALLKKRFDEMGGFRLGKLAKDGRRVRDRSPNAVSQVESPEQDRESLVAKLFEELDDAVAAIEGREPIQELPRFSVNLWEALLTLKDFDVQTLAQKDPSMLSKSIDHDRETEIPTIIYSLLEEEGGFDALELVEDLKSALTKSDTPHRVVIEGALTAPVREELREIGFDDSLRQVEVRERIVELFKSRHIREIRQGTEGPQKMIVKDKKAVTVQLSRKLILKLDQPMDLGGQTRETISLYLPSGFIDEVIKGEKQRKVLLHPWNDALLKEAGGLLPAVQSLEHALQEFIVLGLPMTIEDDAQRETLWGYFQNNATPNQVNLILTEKEFAAAQRRARLPKQQNRSGVPAVTPTVKKEKKFRPATQQPSVQNRPPIFLKVAKNVYFVPMALVRFLVSTDPEMSLEELTVSFKKFFRPILKKDTSGEMRRLYTELLPQGKLSPVLVKIAKQLGELILVSRENVLHSPEEAVKVLMRVAWGRVILKGQVTSDITTFLRSAYLQLGETNPKVQGILEKYSAPENFLEKWFPLIYLDPYMRDADLKTLEEFWRKLRSLNVDLAEWKANLPEITKVRVSPKTTLIFRKFDNNMEAILAQARDYLLSLRIPVTDPSLDSLAAQIIKFYREHGGVEPDIFEMRFKEERVRQERNFQVWFSGMSQLDAAQVTAVEHSSPLIGFSTEHFTNEAEDAALLTNQDMFQQYGGTKVLSRLSVLEIMNVFDGRNDFGTPQSPKAVYIRDILENSRLKRNVIKDGEENLGVMFQILRTLNQQGYFKFSGKGKSTAVALTPLGWAAVEIAKTGYLRQFAAIKNHTAKYPYYLRIKYPDPGFNIRFTEKERAEGLKEFGKLIRKGRRYIEVERGLKQKSLTVDEMIELLRKILDAEDFLKMERVIRNLSKQHLSVHVIQRALLFIHRHLIGVLMTPVMVGLGVYEDDIVNGRPTEIYPSILNHLFGEGDRTAYLNQIDLRYHRQGIVDALQLLDEYGIVRIHDDQSVTLTEEGKAVAGKGRPGQRGMGPKYGVPFAYERMDAVPDLVESVFGNNPDPWGINEREHLDGHIDLIGSTGANSLYSGKIDSDGNIISPGRLLILKHLYNDMPLDRQNHGILTLAAGEGAMAPTYIEYVARYTERGNNLYRQPMLLIISDLDPVALERAQDKLGEYINGKIPNFHVIVMKVDNTDSAAYNRDIKIEIEKLKGRLRDRKAFDELAALENYMGQDEEFYAYYNMDVYEETSLHESGVWLKEDPREVISRAVKSMDVYKLKGILHKYHFEDGGFDEQILEDHEKLVEHLMALWDENSFVDSWTRGRLIEGHILAADRILRVQKWARALNGQQPHQQIGSYTLYDLTLPDPNAFLEEVPEDITIPMMVERTQVPGWDAIHGQTQYAGSNFASSSIMLVATNQIPSKSYAWGGVAPANWDPEDPRTRWKIEQTSTIPMKTYLPPIVARDVDEFYGYLGKVLNLKGKGHIERFNVAAGTLNAFIVEDESYPVRMAIEQKNTAISYVVRELVSNEDEDIRWAAAKIFKQIAGYLEEFDIFTFFEECMARYEIYAYGGEYTEWARQQLNTMEESGGALVDPAMTGPSLISEDGSFEPVGLPVVVVAEDEDADSYLELFNAMFEGIQFVICETFVAAQKAIEIARTHNLLKAIITDAQYPYEGILSRSIPSGVIMVRYAKEIGVPVIVSAGRSKERFLSDNDGQPVPEPDYYFEKPYATMGLHDVIRTLVFPEEGLQDPALLVEETIKPEPELQKKLNGFSKVQDPQVKAEILKSILLRKDILKILRSQIQDAGKITRYDRLSMDVRLPSGALRHFLRINMATGTVIEFDETLSGEGEPKIVNTYLLARPLGQEKFTSKEFFELPLRNRKDKQIITIKDLFFYLGLSPAVYRSIPLERTLNLRYDRLGERIILQNGHNQQFNAIIYSPDGHLDRNLLMSAAGGGDLDPSRYPHLVKLHFQPYPEPHQEMDAMFDVLSPESGIPRVIIPTTGPARILIPKKAEERIKLGGDFFSRNFHVFSLTLPESASAPADAAGLTEKAFPLPPWKSSVSDAVARGEDDASMTVDGILETNRLIKQKVKAARKGNPESRAEALKKIILETDLRKLIHAEGAKVSRIFRQDRILIGLRSAKGKRSQDIMEIFMSEGIVHQFKEGHEKEVAATYSFEVPSQKELLSTEEFFSLSLRNQETGETLLMRELFVRNGLAAAADRPVRTERKVNAFATFRQNIAWQTAAESKSHWVIYNPQGDTVRSSILRVGSRNKLDRIKYRPLFDLHFHPNADNSPTFADVIMHILDPSRSVPIVIVSSDGRARLLVRKPGQDVSKQEHETVWTEVTEQMSVDEEALLSKYFYTLQFSLWDENAEDAALLVDRTVKTDRDIRAKVNIVLGRGDTAAKAEALKELLLKPELLKIAQEEGNKVSRVTYKDLVYIGVEDKEEDEDEDKGTDAELLEIDMRAGTVVQYDPATKKQKKNTYFIEEIPNQKSFSTEEFFQISLRREDGRETISMEELFVRSGLAGAVGQPIHVERRVWAFWDRLTRNVVLQTGEGREPLYLDYDRNGKRVGSMIIATAGPEHSRWDPYRYQELFELHFHPPLDLPSGQKANHPAVMDVILEMLSPSRAVPQIIVADGKARLLVRKPGEDILPADISVAWEKFSNQMVEDLDGTLAQYFQVLEFPLWEGKAAPTGGIDFNQMGLQIKRSGEGVPLPAHLQDMDKIKVNFRGFVPVILDMKPINIPMFLGLNSEAPVKAADHQEDPATDLFYLGREVVLPEDQLILN